VSFFVSVVVVVVSFFVSVVFFVGVQPTAQNSPKLKTSANATNFFMGPPFLNQLGDRAYAAGNPPACCTIRYSPLGNYSIQSTIGEGILLVIGDFFTPTAGISMLVVASY